MATVYPAAIDSQLSIPTVQDLLSPVQAKDYNELRGAVISIEATLGQKPQGIYTTVRSRLDYLENLVYLLTGISPPLFNFVSIGGDLSGSPSSPTVSGLFNVPLDSTGLTDGYTYVYSGVDGYFKLLPVVIGSSGSVPGVPDASPITKGVVKLANDLDGTADAPTVVGIHNIPISSVAPTTGQYLYFDGTQIVWAPLYEQDIKPIFNITLAITSGTLFDVGRIITNPVFTSTKNYAVLTSAFLSNNDNVENKNVLTQVNSSSAFTSNSAYTRNTVGGSVIFTLTANNGVALDTATATITWTNRVYYGQGTPGQSSGAFIAALQASVLTNTKNMNFTVNATASNKIYFAYRTPYGASNFTDLDTGFPFSLDLVSTTIPVTNSYGITEDYTLYESTNVGLGLSNIKVT